MTRTRDEGEGIHRMTLEVPVSVWRRLRKQADAQGVRVSELLRTLVRTGLDAMDRTEGEHRAEDPIRD